MNLLLTVLSVLATVALSQGATNNILCYYESWALWHTGNGKFGPSDIPANKCTQVIYAFLIPQAGGTIEEFQDAATLNALVQLKQQNPNLKVTAAIGGWSAGSPVFSNIVADNGQRASFVQAISDFVNQYKLDGIDIDWEYPAAQGGAAHDNVNYITFLSDLRNKLGNNKIITAAVGASQSLIGSSYNIAEMNKYLTFFNLMTYDFHTSDDGKTGQNAPLYASSVDSDKSLNSDFIVNKFIQSGASASKILLGLGFYGHTFGLSSSNNNLGAPTNCSGPPGPYTLQAGFLSYLEICENLKQGGWQTVYDNQQQSAYSFKGKLWIGYDNVQSIKAKAQYAVTKNLGGVMMWAVDSDDLHNSCGQGSMPLLTAVNSVIKH